MFKKIMIGILLLGSINIYSEPISVGIFAGVIVVVTKKAMNKIRSLIALPIADAADKATYDSRVAESVQNDAERERVLGSKKVEANGIMETLQNNIQFVQLRNELITLLIQHAHDPKNAEGVPLVAVDLIEQIAALVSREQLKSFLEEVQRISNQKVVAHA